MYLKGGIAVRLRLLLTEFAKLIGYIWVLGFIIEILMDLIFSDRETKKEVRIIFLVALITVLSTLYIGNTVFNNRHLLSFSRESSLEEIEKQLEYGLPEDVEVFQLNSLHSSDLDGREIVKEELANYFTDRIYTVYHRDPVGRSRGLSREKARSYAQEMIKQAEKFPNVSPFLLMAIAETEGNYINYGRSWDYGDYSLGIYWLQTSTARWLWEMAELEENYGISYNEDKVIDPLEWGTYLAAYYLEWLIDSRFDGNVEKGIIAYNTGPSVAESFNPHLEPNQYVAKVLGIKEVLKNNFRLPTPRDVEEENDNGSEQVLVELKGLK